MKSYPCYRCGKLIPEQEFCPPCNDLETLRAENSHLRSALECIRRNTGGLEGEDYWMAELLRVCNETATKALKTPQEPSTD
jgi:hypothetical protein